MARKPRLSDSTKRVLSLLEKEVQLINSACLVAEELLSDLDDEVDENEIREPIEQMTSDSQDILDRIRSLT